MEKKYSLVELIDILTQFMGNREAEFIKELESAGVTTRQMYYIGVIDQLGNPNYGELAKALNVSKPSVSAISDKLEGFGFIVRVQSDEDRRSFHIHLTEKGKKMVALHDNVHRDIAKFMEKSLRREDVAKLIDILNKVAPVMK